MIDKLSTIIFLIGLLILICVHIKMMRSKEYYNQKDKSIMTLWVVVSILLIGAGWIIGEIRDKEKYAYDYAYQSGKLIGGTVYASYPENSPGLGWVV